MTSLEIIYSGKNKHKHKFYTEKEGEWVVFRCNLCPGYERRMHLTTGKMESKGISYFLHSGYYIHLDNNPN